MQIGVPKEIKNNENRVAMTPSGVVHLVRSGHEVFIEKNAGIGSGFTDEEYRTAGASIVNSVAEAWSKDMVMKVKEPYRKPTQVGGMNILRRSGEPWRRNSANCGCNFGRKPAYFGRPQ